MLAACLCFKDSARYLEEWLRFHYLQGFRYFFLYDNDSTDDRESVLAPWIAAGLVEWIQFPGFGRQQAMYDDCIVRARERVRWLAFLDDEFLFPTQQASLAGLLEDYSPYAGVAVSWVLFGSGGQENDSDQRVLERFQRSTGYADQHVKCIVDPRRVIRSKVAGHMFETDSTSFIVDEKFRRLDEPLNLAATTSVLRINHYLTKSWSEWRTRRARPEVNTGALKPVVESQWREWDREWSKADDRLILRYLPAMWGEQGAPPSGLTHRI